VSVLRLLYRLYERDVGSGDHRGTLLAAIAIIAASGGMLGALAGLSLHPAHQAEGTVEPGRVELLQSEADGTIRQNHLAQGKLYEAGETVLEAGTPEGAGPVRVYTAPCHCALTRSDLLRRAAGPVRAGELIAELTDTAHPVVRFPVDGRWLETVAPGGRITVLSPQGATLEAIIERVCPHHEGDFGMEAVAALPSGAALAPGTRVTVYVVTRPIPLWRFFVDSLQKRPG